MKDHVLIAYSFDGKGGATAITGDDIDRELENDTLSWVHLNADHDDTLTWLENEISYLDPFVSKALLAEETRPRITEIGNGALIILRGVNLNRNSSPEDMVSIRIWIDDVRIISLQKRRLKAVDEMEKRITSGNAPKTSGDFICQLITNLFDSMETSFTALDEMTDKIEEKIQETPDIHLRNLIMNIRKKAIIYRRYISPQRDVVGQLRLSDANWLNTMNKRNLQEIYDHITRYTEDLDEVKERTQIMKDELTNILSDKMNKNMFVLSIISAIFLPLTFLTGLLGSNINGIPGATHPQAFNIFCLILIIVFILQIIVFKKFKWM